MSKPGRDVGRGGDSRKCIRAREVMIVDKPTSEMARSMLGLRRGPILEETGDYAMNAETYTNKLSAFLAGFFLVLWPGLYLSFLGYKAVSWFLFQVWPAMSLSGLAPFTVTVWAYDLSGGTFRELVFWLLNMDALTVLGALALCSSLILALFILAYLHSMREINEELRREAYGNRRPFRSVV